MNTATVPSRGLLSHFRSLSTALCCAVSLLATGPATAESVDSEILLLVDASPGGLRNGEFSQLMEGYAEALTSSAVIDAIADRRIAVSLAFFGVRNESQSIGVDWMSIGSLAEANEFASRVRALSQPRSGGYSYQQALAQGLASMGDEVGGSDNGFQSAVQIVQVAGSTRLRGIRRVQEANALALSSGVDRIDAAVVGRRANRLESFYASNVIGGAVGGVEASVTSNPIDGQLATVLSTQISQSVRAGNVTAVPEPSGPMMLLSSVGIFLLFCRRRAA